MDKAPPKICLVSSVPLTLWAFYRSLIEALPAHGFEVGLVCSEGTELEFLRRMPNARVHLLEIRREITPLRDVRAVRALARILRREGYAIVHGHTPKGGLVAMLAATLAGVPRRVYTLHGLVAETERGPRRALLTTTERITSGLAKHVLVVGPSLRTRAEQFGVCPPGKLQMFGDGTACGVALDRFTRTPTLAARAKELRARAGVPESAVVVGFVGRMVPDKGVAPLLQAFQPIAARHPDLRLLMIGELEPHRGRLAPEVVAQLERDPRIWRVPYTSEIAPYYAAMDLLVLPTRREGFPYSLLEAAAMELPVVATRATGCEDAVVDGQTGFLTPLDDPQELTAAIERLVDDAELRRALGRAGRRRVAEQFAADRLIDMHVRLYRRLLGRGDPL